MIAADTITLDTEQVNKALGLAGGDADILGVVACARAQTTQAACTS